MVSLCAVLIGQATYASDATERRDIRFYKANAELQTSRIWFTKKQASHPGCHNLYKKKRIYKTVVFGFAQCQLFAKKDCQSGSTVLVKQEKQDLSTPNLLEGYGWYPIGEHKRGVRIKSWSCQIEATSRK